MDVVQYHDCSICKKQFKSKAWLTRHQNICKPNNINLDIDIDEIVDKLLQEAKKNLDCYPEKIRNVIKTYNPTDLTQLKRDIKPLIIKFKKNKDSNALLASYYPKIVLHSNIYFEELERPACTLFAKRMGDKLLSYFANKKEDQPNFKPLQEDEKDGLEYLTGYVLRKFYQRARKQKKEQETICLKHFFGDDDNQVFIKAINRGGLTAAKNELVYVFHIAEETFREETKCFQKKIDVDKIVEQTVSNPKVRSFFNSLFIEIIGEDIKVDLLQRMVKLFLTVRSFSLARDMVSKYKVDKAIMFREKALRKKLKEKNDSQN